jgi:hypothetical protein
MHSMMLGVNPTNEIFNLWYEVTFLRILLTHVMHKNPEVGACIDEESINACRKEAQDWVQERFPVCEIQFSLPTDEDIQKRKEHLDILKKFNKTMGGMFGKPNDPAQEDLVCTDPIP